MPTLSEKKFDYRVSRLLLVLLFFFCTVGFLLGTVLIYLNVNDRISKLEQKVFSSRWAINSMQKYQLEEKDRLLCVSFPDQDIMGIKFGDRRKEKLTILYCQILSQLMQVRTLIPLLNLVLSISLSVIINSKESNGERLKLWSSFFLHYSVLYQSIQALVRAARMLSRFICISHGHSFETKWQALRL